MACQPYRPAEERQQGGLNALNVRLSITLIRSRHSLAILRRVSIDEFAGLLLLLPANPDRGYRNARPVSLGVVSLSDKVVWVAAYPKSGSNWVRLIIHELMRSKARDVEAIWSFQNHYPADAPTYDVMGTRAKVLRTHCHPEHAVFRSLHHEPLRETLGIITIQRHPLDVLLSQLNYAFFLGRRNSFMDGTLKKAEEIIANGEIDAYIDRFLECGGCPEYLRRCRSYPSFYKAWREHEVGTPHLHLRYEEMVQEPLVGIKAVASFLGLAAENVQKVADEVENRSQLDGKFFWRKRAYNYRELLSQRSIQRFEESFADDLRELGYDSR